MPHTVRIRSRTRVTIPTAILTSAGVKAGDDLAVLAAPNGRIVLRKVDPLERYLGSLTGMFPPGYIDALRDEWER
jgi:bifunctional DNA-binding transcriptional regulator/antitoxin component of YhaV-PrlF toxin-antitoxin module